MNNIIIIMVIFAVTSNDRPTFLTTLVYHCRKFWNVISIFSDHFSGPGRAIGSNVSVCVTLFRNNNFWTCWLLT